MVSITKYDSLSNDDKEHYHPVSDNISRLKKYFYYSHNSVNRNSIGKLTRYLKVLRERETELIEYLNTLDEIKEFI